uniref:Uncharacterized protein n=1 Tax=Chromera velia CCMP2878 TaxID=1169474 RepID=A0A0G4FR51_9ALVE|mmetsp:Transcript_32957/g.65249  ORF Transcript_32957/g.65249 Transcript_32957/m.65249 type:complete len:346 (+) Transcript_32957:167-1204(+)|eukprot:Cvel_18321.t1-p1 / transcript=Cvel_18321.t1 / gene=Cvel_18321 / organism=Chromera_velia_CCMP2878 / gene_product=hypothetical protein / transcript_product=hypothetical protein / location=Cvel_scaffold1512:4694-5728(+) / protein_length=345 / sequence_SO=supercontig / SO=protein_coding / is_pseudo=false
MRGVAVLVFVASSAVLSSGFSFPSFGLDSFKLDQLPGLGDFFSKKENDTDVDVDAVDPKKFGVHLLTFDGLFKGFDLKDKEKSEAKKTKGKNERKGNETETEPEEPIIFDSVEEAIEAKFVNLNLAMLRVMAGAITCVSSVPLPSSGSFPGGVTIVPESGDDEATILARCKASSPPFTSAEAGDGFDKCFIDWASNALLVSAFELSANGQALILTGVGTISEIFCDVPEPTLEESIQNVFSPENGLELLIEDGNVICPNGTFGFFDFEPPSGDDAATVLARCQTADGGSAFEEVETGSGRDRCIIVDWDSASFPVSGFELGPSFNLILKPDVGNVTLILCDNQFP